MFTGIIEEIGEISSITKSTITIKSKTVLEDAKLGDSIAVNGVCLTIVNLKKDEFTANVSEETFKITNFSELKSGDFVNLERALSLSSRLGGHIVTGHIDTVGEIVSIIDKNEFYDLSVKFDKNFENYVVKKGSITINGISLTIADINNNTVSVAIIPHTFNNTILKTLKSKDSVNIEFDILAKYVEKNLSTKNNSITMNFLEENGFV
ncbi:TPA: riboflavin synthase [Candidatus Gastranaerophilales bacterium HUM_9]|nr:MAG TPA: riboflavin synthase [Candidatus Gastranaerophilales bacterium HUM_9]HBX34270.1 riboflavin synthase [Cyanobacteria bacterium UBA11440]